MPSVGRLYIQDSRPSANMFFARSASFLPMPERLERADVVSVAIATLCTVYAPSESSSSGLAGSRPWPGSAW